MRLIDADALWKDTTTNIDDCGEFLEVIERQPTIEEHKTGRWISCIERLPEDGQRVLIQNCKGYMTTITYSAMGLRGHIAAWMPLPESYRGDEDGK